MNATKSLCPECNALVQSKVYEENNRVYMEKLCLEHGVHTALISSDYQYYKRSHEYIRPGRMPKKNFALKTKGCPNDCGLCEDHEQHICTPVIEITGRCNLDCPICIAHEPDRRDLSFDELQRMIDRLLQAEGAIDVLNLSGGEPTLHPDYRKFIEYLSSIDEITTVSVSTNGLSFLDNDEFIQFHKEHGVIPSLQLDGADDSVYKKLRGAPLFAKKEKIIEKLIQYDAGFTLIAVIGRGINDSAAHFNYLYKVLIDNPMALSLMFQPLVYNTQLGYDIMDRVTIPDVIRLTSQASSGMLEESDFIPLPCSNANCFSLTHLLNVEGGHYLPFKKFIQQDKYLQIIQNKSLFGTDEESLNEIQDIIFDVWAETNGIKSCSCSVDYSQSALKSVKSMIKEIQKNNNGMFNSKKAFNTASRKIKSIYIHHFMDVDTFDLTRVRRCCTVYPKPDGRFYPLCSYNMLYRGRS
jgi:hypothetical protein